MTSSSRSSCLRGEIPLPSLTPGTATAVSPRAWDTAAAKRRQAERLSSVEHIVTKIIAGLEKNIRHGCTDDNITAIIQQWAGPLAKYVTLSSVGRAGPARRNGRTDGAVSHRALPTTLRLVCTHSAVIMELRSRLPALKEALKGTGIEEVRL